MGKITTSEKRIQVDLLVLQFVFNFGRSKHHPHGTCVNQP